jgi:hypothetical protein
MMNLVYLMLYLVVIPATLSLPTQSNIGSKIMKPFKDAAHSISTGTSKMVGNIKGTMQNIKTEIHERTKPTQQQAMVHSEKWDPRINRNAKKAEDAFYKGDIHLATARSYIDQGGTTKKTFKEQVENKKQFTKHYAHSQVQYASAIGSGTKAITARKIRDTTFHIPGLRGHR